MSIKTVINCDGAGCYTEYEYDGSDYITDITQKGWIHIPSEETDYCPRCKPVVIKELKEENEGVEYID